MNRSYQIINQQVSVNIHGYWLLDHGSNKEDLNLTDIWRSKMLFSTVTPDYKKQGTSSTPHDMDDFMQSASCSTLQYINKTFMWNLNGDSRSRKKTNPQANILKYKKYIKPLVSCSKTSKRVTSPINTTYGGT